MLVLLILIFAIALTVSIICYFKCYADEVFVGLSFIFDVLLVISLIGVLVLGIHYSNMRIIDNKIEIYQTENTKIENQIEAVVKSYKEYENETFTALVPSENVEMLFTMYPELKSNTLVEKQIELYVSNNELIKELQIEKLQYRLYGWWLFFNIGVENG